MQKLPVCSSLLPKQVVSNKAFLIDSSHLRHTVLHGVGVNMLKANSKRRRTKREIEEEKAEELEKENEYRSKMARLDMVEQQLIAAE